MSEECKENNKEFTGKHSAVGQDVYLVAVGLEDKAKTDNRAEQETERQVKVVIRL